MFDPPGLGSTAHIAGAIGSLGSEYVLGLKAVNCQSGNTVAQGHVTAPSKEKVPDFRWAKRHASSAATCGRIAGHGAKV